MEEGDAKEDGEEMMGKDGRRETRRGNEGGGRREGQ